MAEKIDRRSVLKVLGASTGVALGLPGLSSVREIYRPAYFTPAQMEALAALTEIIIPADEHSPGAQSAGVPEYIDTVVSAGNSELKELWSRGIDAMDALARAASGNLFSGCTPGAQNAMLQQLADHEENPVTLEQRFFVTLKRATVNGYYTSSIGIHQELEYEGNQMVIEFAGCVHGDHKIAGEGSE
jgi:hypothetical protein